MDRPVELTWRTVDVDGASMRVMESQQVGGRQGDPLLFLHGWGLSPQTYAAGITRLTTAGIRVIAPCLPGFGGSDGPGLRHINLEQYGARVGRLLDVMGIEKPAFVVGHSFGGGVAIRLAADRPERVRSLTLVSSIGGAPGKRGGLASSSWLTWALGTMGELHPSELARSMPSLLRAFVPNAARKPLTMLLTARLALTANLVAEAGALIDSGLPVLFVWGADDKLILPGALATVGGHVPEFVQGRHGWLLTEPEEFAALLRNALVVHAMLERKQRGQPVAAAKGPSLLELFPPERRSAMRRPRV